MNAQQKFSNSTLSSDGKSAYITNEEEVKNLSFSTTLSAPVEHDSKVNNIFDEDKATLTAPNDYSKDFDTDAGVDHPVNELIPGHISVEELRRIQRNACTGVLYSDPSLNIPTPILESLAVEMQFTKPSQVQAATLPLVIKGVNVLACTHVCDGMTIALVIGLLSKVDPYINCVQALYIAPTRELALQTMNVLVMPLSARIPNLRVEEVVSITNKSIPKGSVSMSHIIVGVSGAVKAIINKGYFNTKSVKILVLDSADTMEAHEAVDTMFIRSKLSRNCQILLSAATSTPQIISYAKKMTSHAYVITPSSRQELVLGVIFQVSMDVNKCTGGKLHILKDIYDYLAVLQSIVFVKTKASLDMVAHMMRAEGYKVSVLHGGLDPTEKDTAIEDFRYGRTNILITTNILARGVDIPVVALVVNYDLPVLANCSSVIADEAAYLDRVGRCGQFGRLAVVINLTETPEDQKVLAAIEEHYRPGQHFITEWDPNDVPGLSDAIRERGEQKDAELEYVASYEEDSLGNIGVNIAPLTL